MSTPAQQGYRMPAEWEPHEATWLSWPRPDGISFPGSYEKITPVFVQMVEALAESEIVRINITEPELLSTVKKLLQHLPADRVEFFDIPTNEPWCRDHGPIFVKRENDPKLAVIDFGYNAWGGKYPPFDFDDAVPTKVATRFGLPLFDAGDFVLEGGSIDVNGEGAVLTTESCLLNPNRNPQLDKEQIERRLKDFLGVEQILWLGDGIEGDDTDGHIDDITRFVSADTVVTALEEDEGDFNCEPLRANLRRLREIRLRDGRPLRVIPLPMPPKIVREGQRLPASYANFYIGNSVVLLPVFHGPNDARAESVLGEVFPSRKIVPIDCRELIWGLGAFHCLTQQQPSAE